MKKSIKLTMILLSGITVFDRALGQNLCVNSRGDTKVASRCPSGYRAVLNLRSTVTEQKLANTPLVTSGSIRPEAVIGSIHIAPKSILGAQIGDGVIETRHIARIHASKIEGLPSFELQPGSVNTEHLRDNAVTSRKIAAEAVGDREVSSISHEKVRWSGWTLPPNTVGERQLLSEAVTSEKIKNETIKNEDIAPNAQIAFSKIALPQGGIPGSSIAAGSIGAAQLAPNSVGSTNIVDGGIREEDLANDAVTSAKIKNETIRNEDIAPNAQIAFSKIALPQGGIPGSSIAAGSITEDKIAHNHISEPLLRDGAVTARKIAERQIYDRHVADDARIAWRKIQKPAEGIPGSEIANRTITGDKIGFNEIKRDHLHFSPEPLVNTFVNLLDLGFYNPQSSQESRTRYYSFVHPSVHSGFPSLFSFFNTAFRGSIVFINYPHNCTHFTLSVIHNTPMGPNNGSTSGMRSFTLTAAIDTWEGQTVDLQDIPTRAGAWIHLSQNANLVNPVRIAGSVTGVFRHPRTNQILTPPWIGIKVVSHTPSGTELYRSAAQVTVTCK